MVKRASVKRLCEIEESSAGTILSNSLPARRHDAEPGFYFEDYNYAGVDSGVRVGVKMG
jgi:hypothetical protein